jgi:NAD(P)-dependent dehydrogenase (short-subunit alcohol dehydrogenase family)
VQDYCYNQLTMHANTWNIAGKTVLITGATSGIGRAAALQLARKGARILFTARSHEQIEVLAEELCTSGAKSADGYLTDFASLTSVAQTARVVATAHPDLQILINNAGVMHSVREESEDGIELNSAVNYFAPVLLTRLLVPTLIRNAPARIINTASSAHREASLDVIDLTGKGPFERYRAYANSKLALVLFTRFLAKELTGTGVTVNAVHPGWINTKLARGAMAKRLFLKRWYVEIFKMRSPADGATGIVRLATDPTLSSTTGVYLSTQGFAEPSASAQDDVLAETVAKKTLEILAPFLHVLT